MGRNDLADLALQERENHCMAAKARIQATLDLGEIYSDMDTSFDVMAIVDAAIKTMDAGCIGAVFAAYVNQYVERVASRDACLRYVGPDEFEAVSEAYAKWVAQGVSK